MSYVPWFKRMEPITLGERFELDQFSTARKTLSPIKSHMASSDWYYTPPKGSNPDWMYYPRNDPKAHQQILEDFDVSRETMHKDGGRITLGDGSITPITKGPNTGKYHLRLGRDKKVHYGTKAQLEKILKQWKITNPPGTNLYKLVRQNPKLLKKIIADIPKMSNSAIQKKYKISHTTLWEIMKDNPKLEFGKQEFNPWTSPKEDIRRLKPELTKRLNLIQSIIKNTEIPIGQIKADDKIIKVLADKVGVSREEFLRNLSQLKQEYGNPTGRIKILQSVKKDLGRFPDPKFIREHLRAVGLSEAVPTLDSVERAARKVSNSRTNLEHGLPRNLIKFFDLPKEYLLKGERTSQFLNQFKKQFDNQMLLAAKKHAAGNMSYADYMKEVNRIRDTVRKATGGYEIGYVDFKDGKPVAVTSQESFLKANKPLGPKNTGVFNFLRNSVYHNNLYNNWAKDKNNKIYSTLNDEIKKMEAKNIRFLPEKELAADYHKLKNIKSKKDLYTYYLKNSNRPIFKAMATAANMKGNAGMKIGTGVATFGLLSAAANAAEPGEKEIAEASVMSAVTENPLKSAAAVAGADIALNKAKLSKAILKGGEKVLAPLVTPGATTAIHLVEGEFDVTNPANYLAPMFWKQLVERYGAKRAATELLKVPGFKNKALVMKDVLIRSGLPVGMVNALSRVSFPLAAATGVGYVAKESKPNIFRDDKGDLRMKDDQITTLPSNMIKDYHWRFASDDFFEKEYGIKKEDYKSNLPEFLDLEKQKAKKPAPFDSYFMGGIASLIK